MHVNLKGEGRTCTSWTALAQPLKRGSCRSIFRTCSSNLNGSFPDLSAQLTSQSHHVAVRKLSAMSVPQRSHLQSGRGHPLLPKGATLGASCWQGAPLCFGEMWVEFL